MRKRSERCSRAARRCPHYCRQIVAREHEADEITREVLLAVRRTFITPFDRGDIKDLITSMDDAIDQMHQTAKAITLFELRSFEPAHAGDGRPDRAGRQPHGRGRAAPQRRRARRRRGSAPIPRR